MLLRCTLTSRKFKRQCLHRKHLVSLSRRFFNVGSNHALSLCLFVCRRGEQLLNGVRLGNLGLTLDLLKADKKLVSFRDKAEMTPLLYAAKLGHANIVKVLLDNGAAHDEIGYYNL